MRINDSEVYVAYNFYCHVQDKGLLKARGSHIHCTVNVIIYRKQCKIETLLLQATDRKWYIDIEYHGSFSFGDLEWLFSSFVYCKPFQMPFFVQLCSRWQDFDWFRASRGLSATAEHAGFSIFTAQTTENIRARLMSFPIALIPL